MHSPEWHERRKKQWGASDMAAVMGLHPFRTAADAVASKCFELEHQEVENDAIRAGIWIEPNLIAELAKQEQVTILTDDADTWRVSDEDPLFAAQPDGVMVERDDELAEAKSTGLVGPVFGRWGDAGSDQVPDWVIIQAQVQMFVFKREVVRVPTAIGKRAPWPTVFVVRREERVIEMIRSVGHEVWENYVAKQELPTDPPASYEVLKSIRRQPNRVISIPSDVVAQREALGEALKQVKAQYEKVDREMRGHLKDAEIGIYEDEQGGDRAVSFFEYDRKGYTVAPSKYRKITVGREVEPEWLERLLAAPQGGEAEHAPSGEEGGNKDDGGIAEVEEGRHEAGDASGDESRARRQVDSGRAG